MNRTADLEISALIPQAVDFSDRLSRLKSEIGGDGYPWYPYSILDGILRLDRLLQGQFRNLLGDLPDRAPVLDIGCADGDLAFFLESLGHQVIAIDHPDTNFNEMRGIRKLKAALNSRVEILDVDVDGTFDLPPGPYELAIFLGILYHLKNPYRILELLSQHARFCYLSTRVSRFTPEGIEIGKTPVAYLVDPNELNRDPTNYWIFSEAGLRRLLRRTGWEICNYMTEGDGQSSRPDTLENDERAYCLLRNRRRTDPGLTARLLGGWHELEDGHRRWTERVFSVELPTPERLSGSFLELAFVYPEVLKERAESIQIQATINGTPLPAAQYSALGEHVYRVPVPKRLLQEPTSLIEFELDRAMPPDSVDLRERGIIPFHVGFC